MKPVLTERGRPCMSMWGSIASGFQDNGGVGISDPYSDTSNIGSSFSDLATSLISDAAQVGTSYAESQFRGAAPPPPPQYTPPPMPQGAPASTSKLVEYGIVGVIAIVLGFMLLKD